MAEMPNKSPEASQASLELAPTMPQNENGDAKLSEAEDSKGEAAGTVNLSESPAGLAAKLHGMLLSLDDKASEAKIMQAQEMMAKLAVENELLLTKDIRKLIQKPVKQLTNHSALGEVALSLSLKLKAGYYAKLIVDLDCAVRNKQTDTVKQKVLHLYKKVFEGSTPLQLDEEFIFKHDLFQLVDAISQFFKNQGVVLAELDEIEKQLNESVVLEYEVDI